MIQPAVNHPSENEVWGNAIFGSCLFLRKPERVEDKWHLALVTHIINSGKFRSQRCSQHYERRSGSVALMTGWQNYHASPNLNVTLLRPLRQTHEPKLVTVH